MKIAILTTDAREHYKDYTNPVPFFGTAPEALLHGFENLPGAEVHVLSCTRAPMKSPKKLAPNIHFHSLYVPKIGWMRTFFLGCVRATRKKLGEIQPDIVHGQGTEGDCGISAVLSGFPNVLTIHGNMRLIAKVNRVAPFSFVWLSARLEALTLPRSLGVVCITHYTQEAVADLAKRTWVLPNAVDAAFFDVDAKQSSEKPPQILCIGEVCLRKNQNSFIRALDSLAGKRKFEIFFLGRASPGRAYGDEFLSLVRARPWCNHVGFANRQDLKIYLANAAMVALPSLEDNCPMVVLEAMAAGVPVVASKIGGVPDLIQEGKTGLFCDPLDAGSMMKAVEKVLTDFSEAQEMAKRAKQEARERFHPKIIAAKHLEIYRDALKTLS